MKGKLKRVFIFITIVWITVMVSSCSMLRHTPSDGIIYSGGTMTIVQSNGQQVIIKK